MLHNQIPKLLASLVNCDQNVYKNLKTQLPGNHIAGRTNADVTAIHFDHQCIQFLPSGFEKFFPNLVGIRVEFCDLKSISQSDLSPFPNLRALWLARDKIEVLERDLFACNLKIEAITFMDNPIHFIYPTIFDNLHKLVALRLSLIPGGHSWSRNVRDKNSRSELLKLIEEVRISFKDCESLTQ